MSTICLAAQRSFTTGEAVYFAWRLPAPQKVLFRAMMWLLTLCTFIIAGLYAHIYWNCQHPTPEPKPTKVENPDTEKEAAYLEDYRTMMDNHHSSHTGAETSDMETAFAQGMSMHHQMAVDMAEIILKYTDDEELTAFADNIITQQKKEIEEMQSYLDDNTDSGSHKH